MEIPQERCACLKELEHVGLLSATALVPLDGSHALFLDDCKAQKSQSHSSGSCKNNSVLQDFPLLPEAEPTNHWKDIFLYLCRGFYFYFCKKPHVLFYNAYFIINNYYVTIIYYMNRYNNYDIIIFISVKNSCSILECLHLQREGNNFKSHLYITLILCSLAPNTANHVHLLSFSVILCYNFFML